MLKILGWSLLVVVVALVAATLWRVQQRHAEAARDYPPNGRFVEVDGHPVHYVEMGAGPDLVLLHGAGGNTRDFTFSLAEDLAEHYRVLIFDRPGLGHTPPLASSGVTVRDQVGLLTKAARSLGANRPVVVGHSFGGALTMAWAVHHGDQIAAAVSIAGATYPWEGPLNTLYSSLSHPVFGPVLARLISAWANEDYIEARVESVFEPQSAPSGYGDHIGVPLILRPASLIANAQQRTDLRPELEDLHAFYGTLDIPVEVVHGDADTTVGVHVHSTRMVEDIAGTNLTVLPGIGHMPQHTNAADVIAAIHRAAERAGLR